MSQEYELAINGQQFKVAVQRLDNGGLLVIRVGDQSFTLKPEVTDDGTWIVNDTSTDHTLKILSRSGKTIVVELNGITREIEWNRVRKESTSLTVSTTSSSGAKVTGGVYAPMPGKITEVRVKIGDSVQSGDTVCVLEAMKMFNELKSPCDGIIKEVNIEPGSLVTPSDLLILIE